MESAERKQVIISEVEAASWVKDGMTVAIGGFINSLHPMAIVRQIIRNRVRNLTLVGSGSAGLEIDLLIAAGCVKKLICPYVGAEELAPIGPVFRSAAQKGGLEIWEIDEGQYYAGLKAAIYMLPFHPWRTGVGTSYPEINPNFKLFQDPIKGETLLAIPPIAPDIAVLHAAYSDPYGDVQHEGSPLNDIILTKAADRTIVSVERIVPNEFVKRNPERTTIAGADAIVRAPYGSHPFASPGFYVEDDYHIKEYVAPATAILKQDERSLLDAYLEKYIFGPKTHADYLEIVGIKQLLSLYEY